MNDHFMQQRRDTQPDPSLFEMRLRAERAERERDIARRDYEVMYRLCKGAEDELDALAAHVERLSELLERAQTGLDWYRDAYPEAASGTDDEHATEVEAALADKPPTSLAKLIAEKQAEIAERVLEIAAKYFHSHSIEIEVEEMLDELRRQAEEKPQET